MNRNKKIKILKQILLHFFITFVIVAVFNTLQNIICLSDGFNWRPDCTFEHFIYPLQRIHLFNILSLATIIVAGGHLIKKVKNILREKD